MECVTLQNEQRADTVSEEGAVQCQPCNLFVVELLQCFCKVHVVADAGLALEVDFFFNSYVLFLSADSHS